MSNQYAGVAGKLGGQPFGQIHRAMLAAGAADGDCQIVAVVADVAG